MAAAASPSPFNRRNTRTAIRRRGIRTTSNNEQFSSTLGVLKNILRRGRSTRSDFNSTSDIPSEILSDTLIHYISKSIKYDDELPRTILDEIYKFLEDYATKIEDNEKKYIEEEFKDASSFQKQNLIQEGINKIKIIKKQNYKELYDQLMSTECNDKSISKTFIFVDQYVNIFYNSQYLLHITDEINRLAGELKTIKDKKINKNLELERDERLKCVETAFLTSQSLSSLNNVLMNYKKIAAFILNNKQICNERFDSLYKTIIDETKMQHEKLNSENNSKEKSRKSRVLSKNITLAQKTMDSLYNNTKKYFKNNDNVSIANNYLILRKTFDNQISKITSHIKQVREFIIFCFDLMHTNTDVDDGSTITIELAAFLQNYYRTQERLAKQEEELKQKREKEAEEAQRKAEEARQQEKVARERVAKAREAKEKEVAEKEIARAEAATKQAEESAKVANEAVAEHKTIKKKGLMIKGHKVLNPFKGLANIFGLRVKKSGANIVFETQSMVNDNAANAANNANAANRRHSNASSWSASVGGYNKNIKKTKKTKKHV
jgi:hypothetical protein